MDKKRLPRSVGNGSRRRTEDGPGVRIRGRPVQVRRAFTIIELFVAVSIIGFIAALTLSAVVKVRESARSAQCIANMKQMGIALHSYASIHEMFPPSEILVPGGNYTVMEYSTHLSLLPFLDNAVLYNALNMGFCMYDRPGTPVIENRTVRNAHLSVFVCPSDDRPDLSNSYRFNRGRRILRGGRQYTEGPFCIARIPRLAFFSDGLANSAVMSERLSGTFDESAPASIRNTKTVSTRGKTAELDEDYIPRCLAEPAAGWNVYSGRYWLYYNLFYTNYNHNGLPNDPRGSCGSYSGLQPPRSNHPQSVNVLFGDGHAVTVGNSIAQAVWTSLGSPDSGD